MNLREYRIKNKLSVIKLASILGVSRQHIYELESGQNPSVKLAKAIEKKLGAVTAAELLGVK